MLRVTFLCICCCMGPTGAWAALEGVSGSTFLAGAYYDPRVNPDSHLGKYLIKPARAGQQGERTGSELLSVAAPVVRSHRRFIAASNLKFDGKDKGNPIAFFVSRAQHEQFSYAVQKGARKQFVTVISMAVSLDLFTDQAKMRRSRRFESLYSRMKVIEQAIKSDAALTASALKAHYKRTFEIAINRLLDQAVSDLNAPRERSRAVFQLHKFRLPNPLPDEVEELLAASASADVTGNAKNMRRHEEIRLEKEIKHILHQFLILELRKRGIDNIAVLPPESPWTDGRVAYLLRQRVGFSDDMKIHTRIDVEAMNGFVINAALLKVKTLDKESNSFSKSRILATQLAAQIFRPSRDATSKPRMVPASIQKTKKKTAIGIGAEPFLEVDGFERDTTRELVMGAVRRAAQEIAPQLVDLMDKTAGELTP